MRFVVCATVGLCLHVMPSAAFAQTQSTLQITGNAPVSSQGGHLQWNRSDGPFGGLSILNQKGIGDGGIMLGEVTTGNTATQTALFRLDASQIFSPLTISSGTSTALLNAHTPWPTVPPSSGFYLHPNGTYVDACSANGCLPGPQLLAQMQLNTLTHLDASAQEVGAQFNFYNKTGFSPEWRKSVPFTAWVAGNPYASGTYVSSNNGLFRNEGQCTSGSTGPGFYEPPGYAALQSTASNVPDGSCVWNYMGGAVYKAYTGPGSSTPSAITEVLSNGNIYRNTVDNCTPASSGGGPSGRGSNIVDGTCRWTYVGDGINSGKSGFSTASLHSPGGGNGWGMVNAVQVQAGYGPGTVYGVENDCNNVNSDSGVASPFNLICTFYGGGSAYNYPILAYEAFGSGSVNSRYSDGTPNGTPSRNPYGAHYGLFFFGEASDTGSVIKDANIAALDQADVVLKAWGGGRKHAIATILDESDSTSILKAIGTHAGAAGIDLSGATFTYGTAIALPPTSFIALNGSGSNFFGYNGASGKLTYGLTASNPLFSIDNNGNIASTGGMLATGVQAINFLATGSFTLRGSTLALTGLPTSSGDGTRGTLCVDTTGAVFVRTTSGGCLP